MVNKNILWVVPLFLLLIIGTAEAVVPNQISFTLKWTNTTGSPTAISHTNYNLTIYDAPASGNILDTRVVNITFGGDGLAFLNYSLTADRDVADMWISPNNTDPRIFIGAAPYASQYLKKNESNTINSTFILANRASIGNSTTALINATHVQAGNLIGQIPLAISGTNLFTNLLSGVNNWLATQNFTRAYAGNITLSGELNHTVAGTLINTTGGINATAVGFGSIPLGVFGNLLAGVNTWTAGQIFGQGLNTSYINVTGTAADTADLFVVRGVVGNVLFRISNTGYIATNGGTLSVRNLTANNQADAVLINTTGAINASAVGAMGNGKLPTGVLPLYVNSTLTPITQGAMIQMGNAISSSPTDTSAGEVIVNLSIGYTCRLCYTISVTHANFTGQAVSFDVISMNASQFNISTAVKGGINLTWIAVGY